MLARFGFFVVLLILVGATRRAVGLLELTGSVLCFLDGEEEKLAHGCFICTVSPPPPRRRVENHGLRSEPMVSAKKYNPPFQQGYSYHYCVYEV